MQGLIETIGGNIELVDRGLKLKKIVEEKHEIIVDSQETDNKYVSLLNKIDSKCRSAHKISHKERFFSVISYIGYFYTR